MRRTLSTVAGVVAMFVVLGAAAPSCLVNQPFTGGGPGSPRVQFEGDSITVKSADDINARLGGSYQVGIDALYGTTASLWLGAVASDAALSPDVVVINLGTNDATCTAADYRCPGSFDPTLVEANYQTMAADFPAGTCVLFVTLDTHSDVVPWNPTGAAILNDWLRAHERVVDWDRAYDSSYFTGGDVHPTAVGRQALLNLETQAIASCLGS